MSISNTMPTTDGANREPFNVNPETATLSEVQPKPFSDGVEMNNELEKLGEDIGTFKPYDSQLPLVDIAHTRIVKCLYQVVNKGENAGKRLHENSYVRIPTKHLTEEHIVSRIAELSPYILGWLQSLEDTEIKETHKRKQLQVYTSALSLDKLIEILEAQQSSSRLNKETIELWFDEEMKEPLEVLFVEKMQLTDESSLEELEKLELVIAAYKAKFASLASGKTFIREEDCAAMIGTIKTCEAHTSLLGSRFIARLEKMSKKEDNLLFSL